jgi:hypothetical protein
MEGFETLFKRNFIESSPPHEPIYLALKNEDHLFCLQCLVLEKVEVELQTESELFNHIEVVHPRLFNFLLKHHFNALHASE